MQRYGFRFDVFCIFFFVMQQHNNKTLYACQSLTQKRNLANLCLYNADLVHINPLKCVIALTDIDYDCLCTYIFVTVIQAPSLFSYINL